MATATTEPWEQVDALDDGRASVDRSSDRMLLVRGADARRWLGDLVTADVATLRTGSSVRSLLLTPTGRIRADMWIACTDDETFLVLQASDQAESVVDMLRPYVLSSAVTLQDATGTLSAAVRAGATGDRRAPRRRSTRPAADRRRSTSAPTSCGASPAAIHGWASTSTPGPSRPSPAWTGSST